MNRKILLSASVLVIFAITISLLLFPGKGGQSVCIKAKCFGIEIADTPDERSRGLMLRDHLDEDRGMLFAFGGDGIYPFWMKDTKIPLDIIWMDSGGKIVYVAENVQPCEVDPCPTTDPGVSARYVLEVNGGTSEKYDFVIGDTARIFPPS
jgi:uncharacterized membrane protein (UPF0127 family)